MLYYNPFIKIIHIRREYSFISFNPVSLGLHHRLLHSHMLHRGCYMLVHSHMPDRDVIFRVKSLYPVLGNKYRLVHLNDSGLPSNLSVFELSTLWIASTPFQNPSTKSWCLIMTASLTPWPCNWVSISFHEASRFFEASKTPFALTPTCAMCLKESGAGEEIVDREMELIDDFDDLFFWRCVFLGDSRTPGG